MEYNPLFLILFLTCNLPAMSQFTFSKSPFWSSHLGQVSSLGEHLSVLQCTILGLSGSHRSTQEEEMHPSAQYTANTVRALRIWTTNQWILANWDQLNLRCAIIITLRKEFSLRINIQKSVLCMSQGIKNVLSFRYLGVCSATCNFTKYQFT